MILIGIGLIVRLQALDELDELLHAKFWRPLVHLLPVQGLELIEALGLPALEIRLELPGIQVQVVEKGLLVRRDEGSVDPALHTEEELRGEVLVAEGSETIGELLGFLRSNERIMNGRFWNK